MKKILAIVFLTIVFGLFYVLIFWVYPLGLDYLFTIRFFNVLVFHLSFICLMAIIIAANAAIKELLK